MSARARQRRFCLRTAPKRAATIKWLPPCCVVHLHPSTACILHVILTPAGRPASTLNKKNTSQRDRAPPSRTYNAHHARVYNIGVVGEKRQAQRLKHLCRARTLLSAARPTRDKPKGKFAGTDIFSWQFFNKNSFFLTF